MSREESSVLIENRDLIDRSDVTSESIEQLDNLENDVKLISNKILVHEKHIKEQKDISIKHLDLFQQTLESLKSDKEEILKLKKRNHCLSLTMQIFSGISIILFAVLLFRSFCF
jgi:hypothetical protein